MQFVHCEMCVRSFSLIEQWVFPQFVNCEMCVCVLRAVWLLHKYVCL